MKLFFTALLLCISLFSKSQSDSFFNFSDTSFEMGQIKRFNIYFDYNHSGIIMSGEMGKHNQNMLDSIANFLLTHRTLKIEIGNHTDFRGNDKYNLKLSEMRARCVADYLKKYKEISTTRYTYKGYGESQPIITEAEAKKIIVKEEFEKAMAVNRRCELKITGI